MHCKKFVHSAVATACALSILASSVPVSASAATSPVAESLPCAGAGLYFSPQRVSLSSIERAVRLETRSTQSFTAGAAASTALESEQAITEATSLTQAPAESVADVMSAADVRDEERAALEVQEAEAQAVSQESTAEEQTTQVATESEADVATGTAPVTDAPASSESGSTASQEMIGAGAAQALSLDLDKEEAADTTETAEADYTGAVVAWVDDYVNVRERPDTDAPIVGKFYDEAVGEILGEENGWLLIASGNVKGYVKAEYCKTGAEAEAMLPDLIREYATVNVFSLNIRSDATIDSNVLDLLDMEDKLPVLGVLDEWVRIETPDGDEGYLFKDYVTITSEYLTAESREEEEARLEKERQKEEARLQEIAAASQRNAGVTGVTQNYTPAANYATSYSDTGAAVAAFALQFVGNPYVWGGSSLTNGADCSGFTMAVYANFGISLPHGTYWQLDYGTPVESLEVAAPGDVVIYKGHAAIYIGNGQIVHASHPGVGIIVSSAYYATPMGIRRFFL